VGFKSINGFSKVASIKDVLANNGNMAISLYAHSLGNGKQDVKEAALTDLVKDWQKQSERLKKDLTEMIDSLSAGLK
jgi:hypothetical protein